MRRSGIHLNYDPSLMRGDCQAARFPIFPLPNLQGERWFLAKKSRCHFQNRPRGFERNGLVSTIMTLLR
jgi:hypothetical protein